MKHHEIIQRRLQVREEWLARTLESFNEQVSDQTEVNIFFAVILYVYTMRSKLLVQTSLVSDHLQSSSVPV